MNNKLTTEQKTLEINLNPNIYGTFAEIGAGQETVRNFFRVGATSGTLAMSISAYDKTFSDVIYGKEEDGRYVTEKRVRKMMDHEINLLEERLKNTDFKNRLFFSYANTVATIDFAKRYQGHGWVGLKFKLGEKESYNEIVLHVNFKQNEAKLQQDTLGILGVNLIYGAYHYYKDPKKILKSLYDNFDKDSIEIDSINLSGTAFKNVDNRLMSLELVTNGFSKAVIFSSQGHILQPAASLYKKNILTLSGKFRPLTNLNIRMFKEGMKAFYKEKGLNGDNTIVLFEMTMNDLERQGKVDEKDFLDRAEILCSLGHNVLITKFPEDYKLVEYYRNYTKEEIGIIMGIDRMVWAFNPENYKDLHGGALEALGKLFGEKSSVYLYPIRDDKNDVVNSNNIIVGDLSKELYKFFKKNKKIIDIEIDTNSIVKRTETDRLLRGLISGCDISDIEEKIPSEVIEIIKTKKLFGYNG